MRPRSCFAVSLGSMPEFQGKPVLSILLVLCGTGVSVHASANELDGPGERKVYINIDARAPRVAVNPRMYGVFFEKINHAGDGGRYAELVQNRDFEAHNAPAGDRFDDNALVTPKGWVERVWFNTDVHAWETVAEGGTRGSICLVDETPLNPDNPDSMRLVARKLGDRLIIPYAAISETSSNCWKTITPARKQVRLSSLTYNAFLSCRGNGVINEAGCWDYLVGMTLGAIHVSQAPESGRPRAFRSLPAQALRAMRLVFLQSAIQNPKSRIQNHVSALRRS